MINKFQNPTMVIPDIDRIDTNLIDLLSRFNQYGVAYSAQPGKDDSKLNIVCGISDITKLCNLSFSNLEIYAVELNYFRLFKFINFFGALIKKKKISISMLIAGDPFRGLFVCRFIRYKSNTNYPLQAQFHGEVGITGFGNSFKNRIKNQLFKFLIKDVDSFRLVSNEQVTNATKIFKVSNPVIVVAPVPISLDFIDLKVKKPNRTLGFVGRLHQERGVDLWIETIKNLKTKVDDFDLRIIGDGPLRKHFEAEVEKIGVPCVFTGRLTQSELKNEWAAISVLLSAAPAESYGMAMREAVLQGCAVVSLENSGSRDVARQYPNSVNLFTDLVSGAQLIAEVLSKEILIKEVERYRNEFVQTQKENINKLVKSWA